MSSKPFFALLLVLALSAQGDPVLPTIPTAVFPVKTYGAKGDGATDDTAALQTAITAAQNAGGGVVELTPGNYLSGPLAIGSNLDLQLDAGATLLALPYGTYPLGGTVYTNFLSFSGNNVAITGPGAIDGQGAPWWAAYTANNNIPHRPYLIKFTNCNNVLVQNVTLRNSMMFHLAFAATNQVTINQATISALSTSPNTDAIDPAGSHYLIENCNLSVGDDDVAVKPQNVFCSDLTVTNCTIGAGHGISVGGETNLGLNGLMVSNCTFNGTTNGLRLKADATEGGPVSNVTYTNLTMVNVQYPIVFYSYYDQVGTPGATSGSNQTTIAKAQLWNASPPDSLASSTIPTWNNITLNNVTATRGTAALGWNTVWGLPSAPFLGLTFNHVVLNGYSGIELFNAQNVQCTGATNLGTMLVYNAQVILTPPRGNAVAAGKTVSFLAQMANTTASAGAVTPVFSWSRNGAALSDGTRPDGAGVAGSNTGLLVVRGAQAAEAGSYAVAVTDALDTYTTALAPGGSTAVATPAAAVLTVLPGPDTGRLLNLSARGAAGAGSGPLIGGFGLGGNGNDGSSPLLLVRGIGPALTGFGVPNVLADPALQVLAFPANNPVASNDNWGGDAAVAAAEAQTGAFALAPAGSLDAALTAHFAPGNYSAVVSGTTSGTALVELYDVNAATATAATPRLFNLSARAAVGTGASNLVAGWVIGGTTSRTVLIRGVGPTLSAFGLTGVLADPNLQVYDGTGAPVAANDNWSGDANLAAVSASVGAFPLASSTSKDAALVLTLPPGSYTGALSGTGTTTGTGLIEIYDVP